MPAITRIAAIAAGVGLLFAAAAVAQTFKPTPPGSASTQVAGATQIDIANLRNEINALKQEVAVLKSETSLVKSQVGNAVAVNVAQAQMLNPLPGRLDGLERRYNRHTHYTRVGQYNGVNHTIVRFSSSEPAEFCTTSAPNNFTCTYPPQP